MSIPESGISHKTLSAGLSGIFLGAFGVHKFMLGYTKAGVIMLVASLASGVMTHGVASFAIGVIALVEGAALCSPQPLMNCATSLLQPRTKGSEYLNRFLALTPLLGAAMVSFGVAGTLPQENFHPLAVLAALLPLQLAALFYVFRCRSLSCSNFSLGTD